jgi:polyhydroxyalkanoate synthesis regulator phasin
VRDELRRMAMFGSGVVELTRYRAEQMVKGLVSSGDLSPSGAPAMVQELVERSRQTRKELTKFVRDEITNQIEGLGLASKREVERLERRVTRLEDNLRKAREEAPSGRALERRVEKLERDMEKKAARPSTGTPVGDQPGTKPKSTTKKTTARKSTKTTAKKTPAARSSGSSTTQAITDAPAPGAPSDTE